MSTPFDVEVGQRLRECRLNERYTQDQIAAALAIPRSAVSLIESGHRGLASSELAQLSRVFGWSAEDLLFGSAGSRRSPRPEGDDREMVLRFFRQQAPLAEIEEAWLASAETQWYRYADLERRLHGEQRWELPSYPVPNGRATDQGERLAEQERRRLNLGAAPIRSMIGLLEGEGVKVLLRPFGRAAEVSGAYFFSPELGPCVLVNADDQPSRRRFTEAHEYCHFLVDRQPLEGEVCTVRRRREDFEMRANAFAAAFLMPANGVREALEEANLGPGGAGPEDVVHLMYRFGVSYQAILWRLVNLRYMSMAERDELAEYSPTELSQRLGYTHEPGETEASPNRYRRLALDAWRGGAISDVELADVFEVSVADLAPLFGAPNASPKRSSRKPPEDPDWL